jgi:hypothetical protein
MGFEAAVAVFDACILYPFHLRNIFVQAAVDRLVHARWTDEIHDEWIRNLAAGPRAIPKARLQHTRQLVNDALPMAMVTGYEHHVAAVNLPDPDDRHVVAAGIAAGATLILTWNLRHFPAQELKKFGLTRETPDEFLSRLYDEVPELVVGSLANARRNLTETDVSASGFIGILDRQRLVQLAMRVQGHLRDLCRERQWGGSAKRNPPLPAQSSPRRRVTPSANRPTLPSASSPAPASAP